MAEETKPTETEATQQQDQQPQPEPEVTDKHGQPGVNKERHDREIAEKDARIAELQAKLDEVAKTEAGRAELKKELDKLRAEFAEKELDYKLQVAGARNAKAARALLAEYENDIEKLKTAEPWLFATEPKGTTGAKPAGAADDKETEQERAYLDMGVTPPKKK